MDINVYTCISYFLKQNTKNILKLGTELKNITLHSSLRLQFYHFMNFTAYKYG